MRTIRAEMDNPSPVPPNCRVTEVSDCWKASKILEWCSAGIPMPVSRTSNRISASSSLRFRHSMPSDTSPCVGELHGIPEQVDQNLPQPGGIALQPFRQIAAHRPFQFQTLLLGAQVTGCSAFSAQSSIEKGTCSSSVLPVSILEKSSMSSMISSKDSEHPFTISRYSRCWPLSGVSSASSVIPRMPFIGFEISWLMLARNWLFASFADSAASWLPAGRCSAGPPFCDVFNDANISDQAAIGSVQGPRPQVNPVGISIGS